MTTRCGRLWRKQGQNGYQIAVLCLSCGTLSLTKFFITHSSSINTHVLKVNLQRLLLWNSYTEIKKRWRFVHSFSNWAIKIVLGKWLCISISQAYKNILTVSNSLLATEYQDQGSMDKAYLHMVALPLNLWDPCIRNLGITSTPHIQCSRQELTRSCNMYRCFPLNLRLKPTETEHDARVWLVFYAAKNVQGVKIVHHICGRDKQQQSFVWCARYLCVNFS